MVVSDGINTAQCPITINVIDTNDCPKILPQIQFINENSAIGAIAGAAIVVEDEDYRLQPAGRITFSVDSDIFAIDKYYGALVVTNSFRLDYETLQQLDVVVFATDDAEVPCTSNSTVTIIIVNVNEPPSLVDGQVGSILEYTMSLSQDPSLPALYVSAHDPDEGDKVYFSILGSHVSRLFRIDAETGGIYATDTKAFDFEDRNVYFLDVIVKDLGGLTDVKQVEIRVLDTNESPFFLKTIADIDENSPENTTVLSTYETISSDPEGDEITYRINTSTTGVPFTFLNNQLTVLSAQLDFEVTPKYIFAVEACDSKALCTYTTFTVFINDVNEAPVIFPSVVRIAENSLQGAMVGSPILATDPDLGQRLQYSIIDSDTNYLFGIQPCNGQIYVKRSNSLDFERDSSYQITVEVIDSGLIPLKSSAAIIIEIVDINEAPIVTTDYAIHVYMTNAPVEYFVPRDLQKGMVL
ncbi:hypothetical protein DVH05_022202 [Phytophthora capsici]|nr:hypothetical protein DVH05_022202 [Phytophthora capsici]